MQFIPSFSFLPSSLHLKFQQCCSCSGYPSPKSLSIPHCFWISSQSIMLPVKHTWCFVSHHSISHLGLLSLPVQTSHGVCSFCHWPSPVAEVWVQLYQRCSWSHHGTGKAVIEAAGLVNQSACCSCSLGFPVCQEKQDSSACYVWRGDEEKK